MKSYIMIEILGITITTQKYLAQKHVTSEGWLGIDRKRIFRLGKLTLWIKVRN